MSNDVILPGNGSTPTVGAANVETLDQGGSATTNNTTAAGSTPGTNDTLHFSSVPAYVALGMVVTDTTAPTVIPGNSKVIAFTGTTVQLSNYVTGAGIGNGDTIVFTAQRQVVKAWLDTSQVFSAGPQAASTSAPAVVQGQQASGSALSNNNPVLVGGSDGTDVRSMATDTSGRVEVVGAAATGAALAGNPVLVAGSDGTDARNLATDSSGRVEVIGGAAAGSAIAGNPVLVGGSDGTNARAISTDTSGRTIMVGAATTGAAVAGAPVLIGGSDGTDARSLATSTTGNALVAGDVAAGSSDSGNPLKMGGIGHTANPTAVSDGQRANFITDKLGKQVVVGSIRDLKVSTPTTISDNSSHTIMAAGGANVFCDLFALVLANNGSAALTVAISDGTSVYNFEVPAADQRGFWGPESAGLKASSSNTAWTAQATGSITNLYVTAQAVKNL
jgi:hypothetical protein